MVGAREPPRTAGPTSGGMWVASASIVVCLALDGLPALAQEASASMLR